MSFLTFDGIEDITCTLSQLRDMVYFLINEDEEDFEPAMVDRAINEGLKKISLLADHEITTAEFTTFPNEIKYYIPEAKLDNNMARVDYVSIDGEELDQTAFFEYIEETTGRPEEFMLSGRNLLFWPIPDDIYRVVVRYRKEFTPLVGDDDYSTYSDEMNDAAIKYACYLLKLKDEELEVARVFKDEWDDARSQILSLTPGVYEAVPPFGGAR